MKKDTETQQALKQMLILTWINANTQRRQDILTKLEELAAKNDIHLINEVVTTIVELAQDEQVKLLASDRFYQDFSIKG